MKRRILYGLLTGILTVNLIIGATVYLHSAESSQKDSAYPSLEMFSVVMERVRRDYVDGAKLSYRDLVRSALKGMLNDLDPHSEFMEPEKFKDLQSDTEGKFGGIGVVVSLKDDRLTVVAPMEDTPGFKAGIRTGDIIERIEGKSTDHLGVGDAVKILRGEPGTEVSITVYRPSTKESKDYKLKREEIKVDMVKDINGKREFPLGENKIGYVRITQFGEKTSDELESALKKLKAQGMRGLVIDLRWNPGGLLDQAVGVCEKFLPRGQLVVTTEGRSPSQSSVRKAAGRGDELDGAPIAVLINAGSASASEIVSGCLQDLKRAIIVGERSFGKGSVQSIIELNDGCALRLTTAKYYTPSHKVIHEKGISPNIQVIATDEEEAAILLRRAPGGVETLEGKERERIETTRDPQLDRAIDMLKGILLFADRSPEPDAGESDKRMAAVK
ncbi:MAG: Carboxy-terminal processing protease CtpA precursor [Verrucomicrobiota bacterium]|jgi:carboxyl-terminal processing protease